MGWTSVVKHVIHMELISQTFEDGVTQTTAPLHDFQMKYNTKIQIVTSYGTVEDGRHRARNFVKIS